jgi:hypothetical protein
MGFTEIANALVADAPAGYAGWLLVWLIVLTIVVIVLWTNVDRTNNLFHVPVVGNWVRQPFAANLLQEVARQDNGAPFQAQKYPGFQAQKYPGFTTGKELLDRWGYSGCDTKDDQFAGVAAEDLADAQQTDAMAAAKANFVDDAALLARQMH